MHTVIYLDLPIFSATNSSTEPDRVERLQRVYGYMVGLADLEGQPDFLFKLARLHDTRGSLTVVSDGELTEQERGFCTRAWSSNIGDGSSNVEFLTEDALKEE